MQIIGLSAEEQNQILRTLAAILWLGNVQFQELADGNSKVEDTGVTDFVAYLMETDGSLVEKVMTSKVVEIQLGGGGRRGVTYACPSSSFCSLFGAGSVYEAPLNPAQAVAGRDALAKAIYNNLFEWIVTRVNKSMAPRSQHSRLIGVLDIYGFEIFQVYRAFVQNDGG